MCHEIKVVKNRCSRGNKIIQNLKLSLEFFIPNMQDSIKTMRKNKDNINALMGDPNIGMIRNEM